MVSVRAVVTLPILILPIASASALVERQSSVTIPAECDVIPQWVVTNFQFFNSSDNLDCVTENNLPPNGACVTADSPPQACDSGLGPCAECGIPACDTGLPLQPAGYGPPDSVEFSIPSVPGYKTCQETNPQSIRRFEVGDGTVLCGGVAYHLDFFGDSNEATSTGTLNFDPITSWTCTNGSTIRAQGSATFEIDCTRDIQNNATCTFPAGEQVIIPVTSFIIS